MAIPLILLLLVATDLYEITAVETEEIATKTGKVQGVIESSALAGKNVQKFLNIPYAEPPVGKLRFAKPEPKKPWEGTLKNSQPAVCWQPSKSNRNLTEDCLILNIWTPFPQPKSASVMIWIHGGAFVIGSSGDFNGKHFVAVGDVILVTINYRLSALGFLSTGDDRIKGNFGLFDQRLAMKWVKENIDSFGGNPQSITIFGESAGGASVSAHRVSEKSWPYFDRAILQSGTITMPWATATKSRAKRGLNAFLKNINCKNDILLLECLRNKITVQDLEKIYRSQNFVLTLESLFSPFGPSIDGDFLTDQPKKLLENGKVKNNDVILGVTKDEAFILGQHLLQTSKNVRFLTGAFHNQLRAVLLSLLRLRYKKAVYNQAVKLYQPERTPSSFIEALKPTVAFQTDALFACATANDAIVSSKVLNAANIFLYQYSFASSVLAIKGVYPKGLFGFAGHAVDISSTFGFPINNIYFPNEDQILSMRMILYWTNFAKYGDPNLGKTKLPITLKPNLLSVEVDSLPKWPHFTDSKREYLDMESLSRMIIKTRLRETYCNFWKDPEGFTKQVQVGE